MPPTILLNMIVKNEAHVIEKTLANLCDKIKFDYWVISDTGSTDDTKEKIKAFFENRNIPGELTEDEWKDFGYNRSKALEHAYNKSDFLFVFDADDELHGSLKIPKTVDFDSYHLQFGSGYTLNYWRICLVNNRKKWKYVGVLHEYITLMENQGNQSNTYLQGKYYIVHGVIGGRSQDPKKYEKDACVLEKAYNEIKNDKSSMLRNRYSFYLANSYKDARNISKAIEWYNNTINLENGWDQEKYRSCIMLYEMLRINSETEKALFFALQSYKYDVHRVEGIYRLIQYYCVENIFHISYSYYILIQEWYENVYLNDSNLSDKLFVDIMEYDFFLPYYMIIVSDKVNKKHIGLKMFEMIFTKGKVPEQVWVDNILHNFQCFYKLLSKKKDAKLLDKAKSYIKILESKNMKIKESFFRNIIEIECMTV